MVTECFFGSDEISLDVAQVVVMSVVKVHQTGLVVLVATDVVLGTVVSKVICWLWCWCGV